MKLEANITWKQQSQPHLPHAKLSLIDITNVHIETLSVSLFH